MRHPAACGEVEAKEGPLAVVTTGTERFYSNGLDLAWMGANQAEAGPMIHDLHRMWGRFLGLGAVTVAAVNGHAFGAGALLSAAHDRIVMREDRGYWCMPEVDLALPVGERHGGPAVGHPAPPRPCTARSSPATASPGPRRWPPASRPRSPPTSEVLDRAVAWAEPLASKSREVIAVHKRILHGATIDLLLGDAVV